MSLARAHRERTLAAKAAASAGVAQSGQAPAFPEDGPAASAYQALLVALHNDLRELHDVESIERKIEMKRAKVETYVSWVAGALETPEGDQAPQDEIVVTMLVWALDLQEWEWALDIGAHVLKHGLSLPERYKRNPACLIVEQIADAAKVDPACVDEDTLHHITDLADVHDMPDQVRAKAWRARGLAIAEMADAFDPEAESASAGGKPALVDAALAALNRALALDKNVGIKKKIEQLGAEARRLAADAQQT